MTSPELPPIFDDTEAEAAAQGAFYPMVRSTVVSIGDRGAPEAIPDTIVHYMRYISESKKWEKFVLKKLIGDLNYIFSLSEYDDKIYTFDFSTEEYQYALTELDEAGEEELVATCAQFIEDASRAADDLRMLRGWGSPASYSRSEIDACREAILSSPKNELSREEVEGLEGNRIFDEYRELFGEKFPVRHMGGKWRSRGRARLFRSIAKRALPGWELQDEEKYSAELYFKRKDKPAEMGGVKNLS